MITINTLWSDQACSQNFNTIRFEACYGLLLSDFEIMNTTYYNLETLMAINGEWQLVRCFVYEPYI